MRRKIGNIFWQFTMCNMTPVHELIDKIFWVFCFQSVCGSSNEKGSHKLLYLDEWSPVGGTIFRRIRKYDLIWGGESLGHTFPS